MDVLDCSPTALQLWYTLRTHNNANTMQKITTFISHHITIYVPAENRIIKYHTVTFHKSFVKFIVKLLKVNQMSNSKALTVGLLRGCHPKTWVIKCDITVIKHIFKVTGLRFIGIHSQVICNVKMDKSHHLRSIINYTEMNLSTPEQCD